MSVEVVANEERVGADLPEYLPARMLNEFVYCPRLFWYEWVEGQFAHSVDTVEGSQRHEKLERREDALPAAAQAAAEGEKIHSRSVQLAGETHRLIARMDLIEGEGDRVVPVDYKIGSPREADDGPAAWDTDRVQVAAQALILRDNGYRCDEGVIYYVATRQRVTVPMDDTLIAFAVDSLKRARETAAGGMIPLPLVDSPKCPRCSLVGICMPDETLACRNVPEEGPAVQGMLFADFEPEPILPLPAREEGNLRRLVPARDDLRPLYLNTQGLYVGKSGEVLTIKEKGKLVQEVRLIEISQLNLMGNIQLTTQAVQALCQAELPICYFSQGGWFYGLTRGHALTNIMLRREQFRLAENRPFALRLARALTAGKIRNQRTLLQRNHLSPPRDVLALLRELAVDAERADDIESLLGIEGAAARAYFANFAGMIKLDDDGEAETKAGWAWFGFQHRNRRPPRDPVNALLSLAYSLLAKDLTIVCHAVGFDPYLGFYHQPRFGRPALALDLLEPFRPLIADSVVLTALNTRMIGPRDFIRTGNACALTPGGRRSFFRAYEQRMDTLVTHPLFGYRVNYRRVLEIQTRLLARVLTGEMAHYPVFVTR